MIGIKVLKWPESNKYWSISTGNRIFIEFEINRDFLVLSEIFLLVSSDWTQNLAEAKIDHKYGSGPCFCAYNNY